MINSMTGYGRAARILGGRELIAELKAVNHRYFEVSVRIPRSFSFLEERIKQRIQKGVSRGKLEFSLLVNNIDTADTAVELNLPLAKNYAEAVGRIASELNLPDEINAGFIARFPEVFNLRRVELDEEQAWRDVSQVLETALAQFCAMRTAEGEKLKQDMADRLAYIAERLEEIEKQSAGRLDRYREKLAARMQAVLENTEIDQSRILLEAALFADRAAVDEETVRLRSHLEQFKEIMAGGGSVGRKLDFLVQEMNREVNTIGSKAGDLEITAAVVDLKAEIEKIREQIQNIE